jgi:hypothetical protein
MPADAAGVPKVLIEFFAAVFLAADLILVRIVETWTEDGKKKSRIVRTEHLTVENLAAPETWQRLLQIAEREKGNLFFGVCPRPRVRADKAHHIRTVRVLWADLDGVDTAEALARCDQAGLPPPSAVVASGHGAHLYWILAEPYVIDDYAPNDTSENLSPKAERIQAILKGIRAAIGGDHVQDLARILRLPGSLNYKNARNGQEPVPCGLVHCDPSRRYPLTAFEPLAELAALASEPAPSPAPRATTDLSPALKQRLDELVRECATAADRSKADFSLCCWAVEQGIDQEVVWQQVQHVGKPAERGQAYFDDSWEAAEAHVQAKDAARPSANGTGDAPAEQKMIAGRSLPPIKLGNLTLHPERPRRTSGGKVTVAVSVVNAAGECLDRLTISDSAGGRRDAVKALKALAPNTNPGPIVGKVLVEAAAAADREQAAPRHGPTVASILAELVPPRFKLVFRTDRGAYSETRGAEVAVAEFARFCPPWLVEACKQAADSPPNRLTLFRTMAAELQSLWAKLVEDLPTEDKANVGPTSPASRRFRRKLIEALTAPLTFEVSKTALNTSGEVVAGRSSLIERLRTQAEEEGFLRRKSSPAPRERWRQVQRAFDCFWRPARDGGKTVILVGLRYRIGFQTKVALPGVHDQDSLRDQCQRAGVSSPTPVARGRLTDGTRLVILSQAFTRELMALPRALKKPPPLPQKGPPAVPRGGGGAGGVSGSPPPAQKGPPAAPVLPAVR